MCSSFRLAAWDSFSSSFRCICLELGLLCSLVMETFSLLFCNLDAISFMRCSLRSEARDNLCSSFSCIALVSFSWTLLALEARSFFLSYREAISLRCCSFRSEARLIFLSSLERIDSASVDFRDSRRSAVVLASWKCSDARLITNEMELILRFVAALSFRCMSSAVAGRFFFLASSRSWTLDLLDDAVLASDRTEISPSLNTPLSVD
mmetsp:Transcript_17924/g.26847  ORF Transcript_17924/g.26847 Transcript_17924/m.26847 type:complete len:207 (+) Transcript_17924:281-901(+)